MLVVGLLGMPAQASPPGALPPKSFYGQYARHFVASIAWPESLGFSSENSFNFCIIGDASEISAPPPSKWNFLAPVNIVDANSKDEHYLVEYCHAIFIASNEESRLSRLINLLGNRPILTISPIPRFISRGGMFGLVRVGDSIRFTINRNAIDAAGLRITDPRVLDLAVMEEG